MATTNSARRFAAVAYNEVLLNSKRPAPYIVAALCAGNALLWWGWGPATGRGLATNSDAFIAGVLPPYSFLFLPLYTALIMADPAIRDVRTDILPLIFSKPISRAEYLLGKFSGNFLVLACCQSAFVLMLFVLQWIPKRGMIVQEAKFFPYLKHFVVFVVISHLVLAAVCFTVGTLTRNAKIVYGLGIAFYPLYIAYQTIFLSTLPWRWKLALDPLVMDRGEGKVHTTSAELLNRLTVVYNSDLILNRVLMILLAAGCLTILYRFFTTSERSESIEKVTVLKLSTATEGVYYPDMPPSTLLDGFARPDYQAEAIARVAVPGVVTANTGMRANMHKLIAALRVEFQLLAAERSLVAVMPLAVFVSVLEIAFYNIPADVSQSAAYATNTAKLFLLFLIGLSVFYTGEAMHRDREMRIESVIWTMPVANNVVLLSKFFATLLLLVGLMVVVGIAAVAIQIIRGRTPIDLVAYIRVYGIVLLPGAVFAIAISLLLNVLLRNKYLVYALSIGTAVGLFYLYGVGYKWWVYNPLMYQIWTYTDLISRGRIVLIQRFYWLAIAATCLLLAHLFFERRSRRKVNLPLPFELR